jgi:hypothetical protein
MNEHDQKLMKFFYDIDNIISYRTTIVGLDKYQEDCEKILKEKLFSDINLQDEKGNTYLHYIAENANWNWFIKLLGIGADPTIVNHKGKNAFQSCKKYDGIHNFWRISTNRAIETFSRPDWDNNTQGYAINYKQFIFKEHIYTNEHSFKTFSQIMSFLEKTNLATDLNKIALVGVSQAINVKDKIEWFNNNYSSPEHNTHLFCHSIFQQSLLTNKDCMDLAKEVLKRDMIQNNGFNKVAAFILNENKTYGDENNLCRMIIKKILENNFDLEQKVGYSERTLLSMIHGNSVNHTMLLEEELEVNSKNETDLKKKIKI